MVPGLSARECGKPMDGDPSPRCIRDLPCTRGAASQPTHHVPTCPRAVRAIPRLCLACRLEYLPRYGGAERWRECWSKLRFAEAQRLWAPAPLVDLDVGTGWGGLPAASRKHKPHSLPCLLLGLPCPLAGVRRGTETVHSVRVRLSLLGEGTGYGTRLRLGWLIGRDGERKE